MERGKFSDRFGRFRYTSLGEVPIPRRSRVSEDFSPSGNWTYAKSFGALESDLAKGVTRSERWNYPVRWRRWSRKRVVSARSEAAQVEIISGWLGTKERRGTWKSRYFILLGGTAAATSHLFAVAATPADGEDENEASSHDEGDDEEEAEAGRKRKAAAKKAQDDIDQMSDDMNFG